MILLVRVSTRPSPFGGRLANVRGLTYDGREMYVQFESDRRLLVYRGGHLLALSRHVADVWRVDRDSATGPGRSRRVSEVYFVKSLTAADLATRVYIAPALRERHKRFFLEEA